MARTPPRQSRPAPSVTITRKQIQSLQPIVERCHSELGVLIEASNAFSNVCNEQLVDDKEALTLTIGHGSFADGVGNNLGGSHYSMGELAKVFSAGKITAAQEPLVAAHMQIIASKSLSSPSNKGEAALRSVAARAAMDRLGSSEIGDIKAGEVETIEQSMDRRLNEIKDVVAGLESESQKAALEGSLAKLEATWDATKAALRDYEAVAPAVTVSQERGGRG